MNDKVRLLLAEIRMSSMLAMAEPTRSVLEVGC